MSGERPRRNRFFRADIQRALGKERINCRSWIHLLGVAGVKPGTLRGRNRFFTADEVRRILEAHYKRRGEIELRKAERLARKASKERAPAGTPRASASEQENGGE